LASLIALPVLAFTSYGQNPKVAGLLIGAWGGGRRGRLGQALPLWLLVVSLPAAAAVAMGPEGRAGPAGS
jgi:hypothetical protein